MSRGRQRIGQKGGRYQGTNNRQFPGLQLKMKLFGSNEGAQGARKKGRGREGEGARKEGKKRAYRSSSLSRYRLTAAGSSLRDSSSSSTARGMSEVGGDGREAEGEEGEEEVLRSLFFLILSSSFSSSSGPPASASRTLDA